MNNLIASDLPTLAYLMGILIASYLILRSVVFPIIKRGARKTTTYIDAVSYTHLTLPTKRIV